MVKVCGNIFVMGDTIQNAQANKKPDYLYSFDMLGEEQLMGRCEYILRKVYVCPNQFEDSISVKLSAIHPDTNSKIIKK